jgi:general secretion pathway protein E
MKDLGVPPFLLGSCMIGVMAQRLLRRVCTRCAQEASLTPDQLVALGAPLPLLPDGLQIRVGAGCVHCRGTGYYGRTGVFEILPVNAAIRDAIAHEAPETTLTELARAAGMRTLREAAVRKLAQGQTAFTEVVRMTSAP